jgi:hypothetical protein
MNVKNVSRMVILVGFLSTPPLLAVGPNHPEAVAVETTDAKGTTVTVGYIYTHLLTYDGDELIPGLTETDFGDVSGGMHGILAGLRFRNGIGWSVQAAYGPEISLDAEVSREVGPGTSIKFPVNIDMSRFDVEGLVLLPVPKWLSVVLGGWDVGVKYAFVEKTWSTESGTALEHTNSWTGPMIGVFGSIPLVGRNSPLSLFWTANFMYVYGAMDFLEGFPSDYAEDRWLAGGNGTIGLSFDIANRVRMSAGYRIQVLGEDLPHDQYQGIIGSAAVLF